MDVGRLLFLPFFPSPPLRFPEVIKPFIHNSIGLCNALNTILIAEQRFRMVGRYLWELIKSDVFYPKNRK